MNKSKTSTINSKYDHEMMLYIIIWNSNNHEILLYCSWYNGIIWDVLIKQYDNYVSKYKMDNQKNNIITK